MATAGEIGQNYIEQYMKIEPKTITFSYAYDNTSLIYKECGMEIGGTRCHLCGANKSCHDVVTNYKDGIFKTAHDRTEYCCGTVVTKTIKKHKTAPKVYLGKKCLRSAT